ncbi:acyl-CoA dehydrogenase family protein [Angustibacter sp. McL0619]|uniref:acyl-CoA dehydrogenase family protein n=1 Tax=Angustibacter sp. McL0619 TaxID=3415676 RepID=UPI003CEBDA68
MLIDEPLAPELSELVAEVDGPDVEHALRLSAKLSALAPLPASGRTTQRWQLLVDLAARDLTVARVAEAHLDAVAILAEAAQQCQGALVPGPQDTWGVFAAEGPGVRLDAAAQSGHWVLDGTKPWCSLAGRLSHALVTAHVEDGRRLFAVRLDDPGVHVEPGAWHARGLVDVPSGPVHFERVPATPVGETGWYLRRPGFGHGGIGVAACWLGGALAVAAVVREAADRRPPDQLASWHLGSLDLALHTARLALRHAAGVVDGGAAQGAAGDLLALRTRSVVAQSAELVLERTGHATGPAPLTRDENHARRVADLTVYLRQHHAERDVAALGAALLAGGTSW